MSNANGELRHICWSECFSFTQLFRAFKLAISPSKWFLVFCGVLGVYMTGRILDGVWAPSSQPAIVSVGGHVLSELDVYLGPPAPDFPAFVVDLLSELDVYLGTPADGEIAVSAWLESTTESEGPDKTGVFNLLLIHSRQVANDATVAASHGDIPALAHAIHRGMGSGVWLFDMHPWFGIIFGLASLAIWSLFGGAVCRMNALHATRDEAIGIGEALKFSRSKFLCFFSAPLLPLIVVIGLGIFLFLGGLIGWIGWAGEIITGGLFFIAAGLGLVISLVIIGGIAGVSLTFPTIAVEGSDSFDAQSRAYSYVFGRPWRAAFYALVSLVYGAICLLFVKLVVRISLWAVHFFAGASMNWGNASMAEASSDAPGKMDALWHAPSLLGGTPFWGAFDGPELAGASWFGQLFFKAWIYIILGIVAAYVISFFFSASTLIYLLLRRQVDATDLDEVYVEEADPEATPDDPTVSNGTAADAPPPEADSGPASE